MRFSSYHVCQGLLVLAAITIAPALHGIVPDFLFVSEVHYNDNVSRTDRRWSHDERGDTALHSAVRAETGRVLEGDLRWAAAVEVGGELWWTYSGLNNLLPMADVAITRRFGLGPTAPYVRVEAAAGHAFYRESFRDGWIWKGGLVAGRRFHERLALEGGYRFEDHRASDRFFRSDGHDLFVEAEIALTPRVPLFLRYNFRHGVIHSYTAEEQAELAESRRGMQDTFNDLNWVYRARLDSHTIAAGIAPVLTETLSMEFIYAYQHSRGSGFRYDNNLWTAALVMLF